jgi:hypothetical protein
MPLRPPIVVDIEGFSVARLRYLRTGSSGYSAMY